MDTWVVLLVAALGIATWVAYSGRREISRLTENIVILRHERDKAKTDISNLKADHANLVSAKDAEVEKIRGKMNALNKIIEERKMQFPWLATAIADFDELEAKKAASYLRNKKHPAFKAAQTVSEYGAKRRESERRLRLAQYRAEYYERLFPWILDYVGDDVPDSIVDQSGEEYVDNEDPAKHWLTKAEFESLTSSDKYQRALDNWKRRRKTNWEIGREYERYVGYLYETEGYRVDYTGAVEGFADMGRDIVARKTNELLVIQCKYWSSEKVIREKHVFQLFGTSLEYAYRLGLLAKQNQPSLFTNPIETIGVRPMLYTSTVLSDEARQAASTLGVLFFENAKISEYPVIKCNIAQRDGAKIYHMPFDQQYDRTKINADRGECFAYTVMQAERMGFRRAWRWRPEGTAG